MDHVLMKLSLIVICIAVLVVYYFLIRKCVNSCVTVPTTLCSTNKSEEGAAGCPRAETQSGYRYYI